MAMRRDQVCPTHDIQVSLIPISRRRYTIYDIRLMPDLPLPPLCPDRPLFLTSPLSAQSSRLPPFLSPPFPPFLPPVCVHVDRYMCTRPRPAYLAICSFVLSVCLFVCLSTCAIYPMQCNQSFFFSFFFPRVLRSWSGAKRSRTERSETEQRIEN